MNKPLIFVLLWSMFCFSLTIAMFQLDIVSIASVAVEFWLTTVGIDLVTGD